MIHELEEQYSYLFAGMVRCVQDFLCRERVLELPPEEIESRARGMGYESYNNLKASIEYYRGMALGYATAAWTVLHGRPPKDIMEEVEISEGLRKIREQLKEASHGTTPS